MAHRPSRLDIDPAGPEPLGILAAGEQWDGRGGGGGAGGGAVGGRLGGKRTDRPGRRFLVRGPPLDHRGTARTLLGVEVLAVRERHRIATSLQVEVPEVSDEAMLVMVHRLDTRQVQVTVLNFSSQPIAGSVTSQHLASGAAVIDMVTDQVIAEVDHEHTFAVWLEPHQGLSLVTTPADALDPPRHHQPHPR